MALTLGTFTKQDNGSFTGILKTLNVQAALSIVPVDKVSEKAPDHRIYAGSRYEVGAGWNSTTQDDGWWLDNISVTGVITRQTPPASDNHQPPGGSQGCPQ